MKRITFIIFTAVLFISTLSLSFAESTDVIVSIPEFDVSVNGELIDIEHSMYPVLSYKDVTYFPMTSDYLAGIGLELYFDSTDGLKINVKDEVGAFEQNFLGALIYPGSQHKAQIASFNIEVNGKTINNSEEEYPILLYNNITYFPMTWRFSVEEFHWDTEWSEVNGLSIDAVDLVKESDLNLREISSSIVDGVRIDDIEFDFESDENIIGEWHCVDFLESPLDFRSYKKSFTEDLNYESLIFAADGSLNKILRSGFNMPSQWTKGLILDGMTGPSTASRYIIVEAFNDEYLFVEFKNGDYNYNESQPDYYVYARGAKK